MARPEVGTMEVRWAPATAPRVVATSRNMPTRMFEYPSLTYAAAAPDDVAITETSDAPIANRRSTPRSSVRAGVTTTAPPNPVSAPRKPARAEMAKTMPENERASMYGGRL